MPRDSHHVPKDQGVHPSAPAASAGASSQPKEESVTLTRKDHEELRARIEELEAMRDRYLRAAADFDNAKKRLMREREEFLKFAQEAAMRELLPVLDNFERALSHAADPNAGVMKGLIAGIQMVHKQLGEILKNQGLKRVVSVGEILDPHRHEAVGFVFEPGREDEIVEEVGSGYFLHERLLRAAKVRIRKAPPSVREEKQEELT